MTKMRADWHRLNFILHWSAIMLMTEQKTLGTMTKTPYSQHLKYDFKNTTGNKCVTTSNSKRCLEKYYWWQNFKPLSLEPNLNFSQGASVSLPLIINKDGMTGVAFMFWLFFFFCLVVAFRGNPEYRVQNLAFPSVCAATLRLLL